MPIPKNADWLGNTEDSPVSFHAISSFGMLNQGILDTKDTGDTGLMEG